MASPGCQGGDRDGVPGFPGHVGVPGPCSPGMAGDVIPTACAQQTHGFPSTPAPPYSTPLYSHSPLFPNFLIKPH